jgi:hypothetical protein
MNGEQVNPARADALRDEIRAWYEDNHDSGLEPSGDIWNMYPKQSDLGQESAFANRHPVEAFEQSN